MKCKYLFLVLVFSVFIISCDKGDTSPKVRFDLEKFNTNRDNWEALNLQNYSYEYSNSGYSFTGISSHISVQMTKGEESEVVALVENGIQDPDRYLIDDLFEEILNRFPDDGMADISSSTYLKEIKVVYDETYHFPSEVHYLYHIPEDMLGIWNMHHFIKKFQVEN